MSHPPKQYPVQKSDADWQAQLTPQQYAIARQKGTERAFTGEYNDFKGEGTFACVCCGQALFASKHKYNSGSGWPSFWQPIANHHLDTETDTAHGMVRTEVLCANCGAHLGHVFSDGPQPTGLRYCINSACLKLQP